MVSYLVHFEAVLHNARYIITKYDNTLSQNASGFSLQNTTVLLQNATVIAKCNVYYKMHWLNK